MTQINRIKLFVSDLLDGQLSERQCAIVLGEDKEKKERKKGKGKEENPDRKNRHTQLLQLRLYKR